MESGGYPSALQQSGSGYNGVKILQKELPEYGESHARGQEHPEDGGH